MTRCGTNLYPPRRDAGDSKLGGGSMLELKPVLVDLSVVRAVLGQLPEAVEDRIDNGDLRWVFDVSPGRCKIRALRVWSVCLSDPERAAKASLGEVVSTAVGSGITNPWVAAVRIETRWMASSQLIRRWRLLKLVESKIEGGRLWLLKDSLTRFLMHRVVI